MGEGTVGGEVAAVKGNAAAAARIASRLRAEDHAAMPSRYAFLVDTYATETLKVLTVWWTATPADLDVRPRKGDRRGRTLREHMIHQCQSENGWFTGMFGIEVPHDPPAADADRTVFLRQYGLAAEARLRALAAKDDAWWETEVPFFEVRRPRTWIMVRRIAHTAHHRGQQTAMLRALGRDLYSTYGPTADTGGLPKDKAPVIYPFAKIADLVRDERFGASAAPLPPPTSRPVTERPAE
jgi:uncharacterized damage-inducible protein DinB